MLRNIKIIKHNYLFIEITKFMNFEVSQKTDTTQILDYYRDFITSIQRLKKMFKTKKYTLQANYGKKQFIYQFF